MRVERGVVHAGAETGGARRWRSPGAPRPDAVRTRRAPATPRCRLRRRPRRRRWTRFSPTIARETPTFRCSSSGVASSAGTTRGRRRLALRREEQPVHDIAEQTAYITNSHCAAVAARSRRPPWRAVGARPEKLLQSIEDDQSRRNPDHVIWRRPRRRSDSWRKRWRRPFRALRYVEATLPSVNRRDCRGSRFRRACRLVADRGAR